MDADVITAAWVSLRDITRLQQTLKMMRKTHQTASAMQQWVMSQGYEVLGIWLTPSGNAGTLQIRRETRYGVVSF